MLITSADVSRNNEIFQFLLSMYYMVIENQMKIVYEIMSFKVCQI